MQTIAVSRIFLDLENPRHEPYENEAQVIDYLCRYENILPLAKDIAENGLNPLELLAVLKDTGDTKKGGRETYTVAEGNRRLCALKLLDDPDRAPPKLRQPLNAIAKNWNGISSLSCMVFDDREAVRIWLGRIHEGEQGGIGRKKWNADQTARFSGDSKNKSALAILDYAEKQGLISPEDRRGKLTTVQRYLTNAKVRESLGIDATDPNNIRRTRPQADFDLLLRKFIDDLKGGHVNSRNNKGAHSAYALELGAIAGQSGQTIAPEPLEGNSKKGGNGGQRKRPKKQKPSQFLTYDDQLATALESLGGSKLPSLYTSICSVQLDAHTPLVTVGAWAFIESLSAKAGRTTSTDFVSFFSKTRLQNYGLSKGKGDKAVTEALRRVSTSGDVTKHDGGAALFNGAQLINDLETLTELLIKCAEEAKANNP